MKRALVAAVSLSILASCGGDSRAEPPVIQVSAGSSPNGGGATNESLAAGASADAKMIAPYFTHPTFETAGDLPDLDSDADAWILREREVATDELEALAAVFGIDGDFVETTEGAGESWEYSWWQAGSIDGTEPSLSVQNDVQISWWYSEGYDPSSSMIAECVPTTIDDPSGAVAEPCEIPPMDPPAGVPSADEAEALFVGLLEDLGFDANDVVMDTYADDWSAGVTGWLKVGGVKSSLTMSVSFGENGSITYASGFLGRPEKFATYPRIGTAAALVGLQEQYDRWAAESVYPATDVVVDPAVVTDVTADGEATTGGDVSVSSDGASTEVVPADTITTGTITTGTITADTITADTITTDTITADTNTIEPEEIIVTIVGVDEELQTVFGADGEMYLIPSYVFLAEADEYGFEMPYYFYAVSDEYVQESADIVPMMGGSARSSTGGGVIEPAVEPIDPIDSDVSAAQTVADGLVGLTETEATTLAEGKGLEVRVVERDGEFFPATADYRTDRVNLTIVDETVTAATIG